MPFSSLELWPWPCLSLKLKKIVQLGTPTNVRPWRIGTPWWNTQRVHRSKDRSGIGGTKVGWNWWFPILQACLGSPIYSIECCFDMAKRQGHGRKNQKPTDAWSMDGCRAFWRYKTNKEKNESRRIIVKASTNTKNNKWPMSIWSWSVSSKMYSNMPGGEGEDPTLLGKWSNFFGCLVTHGLSSQKRSNLKNTLLVIYFKSFRSPRNQPPLASKKKRLNQQVCFLFTHVPCPSKQKFTLVLIQPLVFFFSPSCEAE